MFVYGGWEGPFINSGGTSLIKHIVMVMVMMICGKQISSSTSMLMQRRTITGRFMALQKTSWVEE